MTFGRFALAIVFASVVSVALATPDPRAEDALPAAEERFEALAATLEARTREMSEDSGADPVLLEEALALGAVAQELFAEGDLETSIPLLEEAIALLASTDLE